MDLPKLSDQSLLQRLDGLVNDERELLTAILLCLREVERRRLFSALGYTSLFEFAVKRLRYSEDQAYRRIQAMRMIRELPEIEEKVQSGTLTLTNLGLAQDYLRREEKSRGTPISKEEKRSVVGLVTQRPSREAERALLALSPESVPKKDRALVVSPEAIELRITVLSPILEKITSLKGLLAHKHPKLSTGELFSLLCDQELSRWSQKVPGAPRVTPRQPRSPLHRQIWERDQSRCTNCGSTYALEVDHILPKAKGGSDDATNLRLLCRSCNQRAAIREFGQAKMQNYLG